LKDGIDALQAQLPTDWRMAIAFDQELIDQGLMSGWRAATQWSPDYLESKVGDELVEIMAGRNSDVKYEVNLQSTTRRFGFRLR